MSFGAGWFEGLAVVVSGGLSPLEAKFVPRNWCAGGIPLHLCLYFWVHWTPSK